MRDASPHTRRTLGLLRSLRGTTRPPVGETCRGMYDLHTAGVVSLRGGVRPARWGDLPRYVRPHETGAPPLCGMRTHRERASHRAGGSPPTKNGRSMGRFFGRAAMPTPTPVFRISAETEWDARSCRHAGGLVPVGALPPSALVSVKGAGPHAGVPAPAHRTAPPRYCQRRRRPTDAVSAAMKEGAGAAGERPRPPHAR